MHRFNRPSLGACSRRLGFTGAVLLASLLVAVIAMTAGAATTNPTAATRFTKVDRSAYDGVRAGAGKSLLSLLRNRQVTAVVELAGKPVAGYQATALREGNRLSPNAEAGLRADIKAKQDALKPRLKALGARVVLQLQDAYNGLAVNTKVRTLAKISKLPGVKSVHISHPISRENVRGVPFIGAPQAWSTGRTGAGVRIAIIDTGIDYTHADFGGPGTSAAYAAAHAHETEPANPALFGPAAPKVKGGFDFVGDNFNFSAGGARAIPHPDPNPLDCNGHGTHVAGTAAGFGVTSDGKTFKGPYNTATVGSHTWNVGPGVAPLADVYAYRVFGCEGDTPDVIVAAAIDRAVRDGVQVISMSLGSPLGRAESADAVASDNAAAAGVTVVASAGNEGPSAYMVGTPSVANRVLSVAAMDASFENLPGANVALSTGKTILAQDSNGAALPSGALPVKVLRDPDGSVSLGCDPAQYVAQGVAGKLVVTRRGVCARVARAIFGQKAGAAAVAMINNASGYPPFEGKITENPDTGEKFTVTIPFLGIRGCLGSTCPDGGPDSNDPEDLVAADGGTARLTAAGVPNPNYKKYASFTSGGPRNPDSAPKPEITAPGVSVFSAAIGTGAEARALSGTSMAAPMTSGSAVLVRQAHPTWNTDFVKAALMNTAVTDPSKMNGYNVRLGGAGVLQTNRAVATTATATTADHLNSLAFGYVPGTGNYVATKSFTLTNMSASPLTYNISVDPNGSQRGATITPSPSSVTVPPNFGTRTVNVTLSIPAAAFAALPDDSTFSVGPGGVVTIRGAVVATPTTSGPSLFALRVPYLVAPRGLSNVVASPRNKGLIHVANGGVHHGNADFYAWQLHDAQDQPRAPLGDLPMDVRDVGVQSFTGEEAGLDNPSDRLLVFAVNNWGQWSNASVNIFDIQIDTDRDRTTDFDVIGIDVGLALTGDPDGRFGSFTINSRTGEIVDAFFADAPMNSSTVLLPAIASEIGVSPFTSPLFSYTVTGLSLVPGGLVDETGTARYSPFAPDIPAGQFVSLDPGAAADVPAPQNLLGALLGSNSLGWLVVTLDDASGSAQADEVPGRVLPVPLPFGR